ncbi:hypothetical protein JCM19046_3489 [Bacillus sp. JCM 19046]|nr:hypothetical protein JCM19045_4286 [Bacillus sp. JCM 19045]GAF18880.1 hypothetical protein JCM19046_3489 [Bacillus sp. JCM 19046]
MNVSTYWDFEQEKGEIIVHKKTERVTNYVSPANSIQQFDEWVDHSIKYIKVD